MIVHIVVESTVLRLAPANAPLIRIGLVPTLVDKDVLESRSCTRQHQPHVCRQPFCQVFVHQSQLLSHRTHPRLDLGQAQMTAQVLVSGQMNGGQPGTAQIERDAVRLFVVQRVQHPGVRIHPCLISSGPGGNQVGHDIRLHPEAPEAPAVPWAGRACPHKELDGSALPAEASSSSQAASSSA